MVACRLQRLWRMGEQGEKGSEELLILFVCSKYFFFHPVENDKMHVAYGAWGCYEFLTDLNASLTTVAWELIRLHNRSKHVDTQCWRSQLSKWASCRNNGYNLPDHCHSSARATSSTLKWSPWYVEGTYQAREGTMCFLSASWLDCKADNLVLSCKIPFSFLLSVRGTVFPLLACQLLWGPCWYLLTTKF